MRPLLLLLFLSLFSCSKAQQKDTVIAKTPDYPFDIKVLTGISDKKDPIMPRYIDGKCYFVDAASGKKLIETGFEQAYPFAGGKAALVKLNGNYGVIDRNGKFLQAPVFPAFEYYRGISSRNNLVYFNNGKFFDLELGVYKDSELEGEPRMTDMEAFKGDNHKWGIRTMDAYAPIHYKTLIEPVYDSILLIHFAHVTVLKDGKVGIVDRNNKILLPFVYDKFIQTNLRYYPLYIGLHHDRKWAYYYLFKDFNMPNLVLESPYECDNMGAVMIDNALGRFKEKGRYHILFMDGSILPQDYEWISDNGSIAVDKGKVYIIGGDGKPFLYYEE